MFVRLVGLALLAVFPVGAVRAYDVYKDDDGYVIRWDPGAIPMQIKMPTSPALMDGTSYATSVQAAMQSWNVLLGANQFVSSITNTASPAPSGTYNKNNGTNEVVMDSKYAGSDFGSNTLAITLYYSRGNSTFEADIVFNTAITWDSYRNNRIGGKEDIRRVAIHELGHVLGLDHPDEDGQTVTAIMNSHVSNIDTMQADDIAGAQLLYGAFGFVPANDNFANATVINLDSSQAQFTGSNVTATKETGESAHAGANAPGHSVWWKWIAPSSASTTITTLGSNFDTVLAVYTGSSVSALGTAVASNDDVQGGVIRTSTVTFNAAGGTTYYIAVDGWGATSPPPPDASTYTGEITLNISFAGALTAAPAITTQPVSQSVTVGAGVTFTAAASGTPAPTYQWQKDGVNIGGATSSSYTIASTVTGDSGNYTVVATNSAGTATSNAAVLTVNPASVAPLITLQPQSQTVTAGGPVTFTAAASGTPAPTYQWQKNSVNIAGATGSSYTIATTVTGDAGNYRVIATNSAGSATSNQATLTVNVAPLITLQPQSQTVTAGNAVTFTATASGTPAPTYQWQKNSVNLAGATGSSYTIASTAPGDAGSYRVIATNSAGTATSNAVALTINVPPVIATQPVSQTVTAGASVTFTAAASGSPPPLYQWQKNGINLAGAISSSYTIASTVSGDAGSYRVIATNPAGSATSTAAVLAVNVAPAITLQPVNQTVTAGNPVTFTVAASGTPAPAYQWRKNGVDIIGATGSSFTMVSAVLGDAGSYTVMVTNIVGSVTSSAAVLTVNVLPAITVQPLSQTVPAGSLVTFTAAASGTPAPTYQWRKDGVNLGGATGSSYTISVTQFADAGSYSVVATNAAGSVTSGAAVLTVVLDWQIMGTGDFDGDGEVDILWRKTSTGEVILWLMNGPAIQSTVVITAATLQWQIAGTGDFNADGKVDILWRKPSTGDVAFWLMNGTALQSVVVTANVPVEWTIAGTGDFNADGKVDILWRKPSTGDVAFWLMNGTALQSVVVTANVPTDWTISGTGDFNADGKVDILWRKPSIGTVAYWLMNGTALQSVAVTTNVPVDWEIGGTGDFSGDGQVDILWRKSVAGTVALWVMNGTAIQSTSVIGSAP